MEIVLYRTYHENGTNGEIYVDGVFICHSIELPWKDNKRGISCIPEGSYTLLTRYSQQFGWHLWVMDVPGRSMILIHPANDAAKELRGCIAPVSKVTGVGKGSYSRLAMMQLRKLVEESDDEEITLTIRYWDMVHNYENQKLPGRPEQSLPAIS